MKNPYLGHESQLYGVEEYRLTGGKGDGMRLLQVKNGKGMEFTVSADRCADISRLCFRGVNMSYFSPCGYVAPAYYDCVGDGFLKSFTAGFLTTCGLNEVGVPCEDGGEQLPLHGTIANTPAEHLYWEKDEREIRIHAEVADERIFSHKLVLHRVIHCSLEENSFSIRDRIVNEGDTEYPVMLLYHMNMGYPLLSEHTELYVPSKEVIPRNERAAEGLDVWNKMQKPEAQFEEQCYFHRFEKNGLAAVYNPGIDQGLVIRFDAENLPFFTEWKMMGERDYVLGLEPGNCHPDGRAKMREQGKMTILQPGEEVRYEVQVSMIAGEAQWAGIKGE
ncbi:MAG: aldose 1-epimerase family protein [Clostridiales bacterium]|nr:aldose 1-epimerase family protein [Clostridiales bacterium]